MKRLLTSVLFCAVGTLLADAQPAQAGGLMCCPPVTCVEKTIICYRPQICVREVPHVCHRHVCREVVETKTVLVPYPVYDTIKRVVYVYKEVPKTVEREVYVALPECPPPCEPCATGCGCGHHFGCCKPNPGHHKIKITTCETEVKPCPVEFVEKVCTYKAREQSITCKKTVVDVVPETVLRKEISCVMVPYEVKVRIPVCAPACCGQ